jgi:hypothetical protein
MSLLIASKIDFPHERADRIRNSKMTQKGAQMNCSHKSEFVSK